MATTLVLVALVLVAPWAGTQLRGDNLIRFSLDPWREFKNLLSIWDPRQDFGGTSGPNAPVSYLLAALLKLVGLPLGAAQRVWVGIILAFGAIGTAQASRSLLPSSTIASLVSGLCFLVSPYTIAFLFPTWLFLHASICPWLVVIVVRAARSVHHWRWAAAAASVIGIVGTINVPALGYAAIPAAIWFVTLLIAEPASRRHLRATTIRSIPLVAMVIAPGALRVVTTAAVLRTNLASTETLQAVSLSSNWSESWRGFGFWVLYWQPRGKLLVEHFGTYATSPWVIVCTFALPVAALIAAAVARSRVRLVLLVNAAIALLFMVGANADADSLFAALWSNLVSDGNPLFALRNGFKAGVGLQLSVALLVGILAQTATEVWHLNRRRLVSLVLAGIVVGATTASAFWTGAIFRSNDSVEHGVPTYWTEAMDWLGAEPTTGSFVIAPPGDQIPYVWGGVSGGDIFASIARRPYLQSSAFSVGQALPADNVRWLASWLSQPGYRSGSIRAIAGRLGLRYIVIRNDIEDSTALPPSSSFDALRNDPDVTTVAEFGPTSPNGRRAVEVLEVNTIDGARLTGLDSPIVVSGDAEAWSALTATGILADGRPTIYSGQLSIDELRDMIASGSPVVITDSNRRRSTSVGADPRTLTVGDTERIRDLFGSTASQSVAEFGDGAVIRDISPPGWVNLGTAHRLGQAFDHDLSTTWLTGVGYSVPAHGVSVRFASTTAVRSVQIDAASGDGLRQPVSVTVVLSDGRRLRSSFADNRSTIAIPGSQSIDGFSVYVDGVAGGGVAPFGFSEITVIAADGTEIDLAERVRVPDDVIIRAASDPSLSEFLDSVDLGYTFERWRKWDGDPESGLGRIFKVASSRRFTLTAQLSLAGPDDHGTVGTDVDNDLARDLLSGRCTSRLLSLDSQPIAVRAVDPPEGPEQHVDVTSCGEITLEAGTHTLDAPAPSPIDRVVLWSATTSKRLDDVPETKPTAADVKWRGSTELQVSGDATAPSWLMVPVGNSRYWRVTVNGVAVQPSELDGLMAVPIETAGSFEVDVTHTLAVPYLVATLLSLSVIFLGAAFSLFPRRQHLLLHEESTSLAGVIAVLILILALAVVAGNLTAWLLTATIVVAWWAFGISPRQLMGGAAICLAASCLATLPPIGPSLQPVSPGWAIARHLASGIGHTALTLVIAALLCNILGELRSKRLGSRRH